MQLISSNLFPAPIAQAQDGSAAGPSVEFGLKYCPSMDLVAVYPRTLLSKTRDTAADSTKPGTDPYYVDEEEDEIVVDVYRLNGQRAFTTAIDSESKTVGIVDIAWREDGIILAITTSDNRVRLVNAFSGKIVHSFKSTSDQPARESQQVSSAKHEPTSPAGKRKSTTRDGQSRKRICIPTSTHYSAHLPNPDTTRSRLAAVTEETGKVLDDLLGLHADVDQLLKSEADLPKELANIDVEQYLPKLSTLPASGMSEDDIFSTRTSIDAILHSGKQRTVSGSIDVIAIAQSNADIHIRVFDSFEVGNISFNSALNLPTGCMLEDVKKLVSHPLSQQIYALVEEHIDHSATRSKRQTTLEKTSGSRLHLLSLDLRFLQQSSLSLHVLAIKATQIHNLIRYLRQIEQQLAREIKTAFDLPLRFIRTLEEDLKEQDGEGSTFQTSAYHALLVGEVSGKFKEWLVDILGDRGVKRWEKAVADCLENVRRFMTENWNPAVERAGVAVSRLMGLVASGTFNVERTVLEGLRNTIDVMAMIGEDLVREVNVEIAGFTAFITWLKREVEAAGLEETSEKLEEMRDNSDHSEVRKVLKYISERLPNTAVKKYIRDEPASNVPPKDTEDDISFYNAFCKARKNTKESFSPPSMKCLTGRLGQQCDRLFRQVARQLQENVLVEYVCPLTNSWDVRFMDCRVLFEPEYPVLNIFSADLDNKGAIRVGQRSLGQGNSDTKATTITLEDSKEILDIKCADDKTVFALVRATKATKILSIKLRDGFEFEVDTRHVFGSVQDSFLKLGLSPWRLEINGRKGRRTMTVLDKEGRGYGVFDLDSVDGEAGGDKDEVMSG